MFRKSFIVMSLAVAAIACKPQNQGSNAIKMKGSDTQLPIAQNLAAQYMEENTKDSISVVGGGSGVGISSLMDGTTDIALASRDLKMEEQLKFKNKKIEVVRVINAYDALAVVVNASNPVNKLTREQLEDIFTEKITNWKEVGGPDMPINAFSRESSSGTYEFFKDHVMSKKNFGTGIKNMPATGAIIQAIEGSPGAIGYVGLAYLSSASGVKGLEISYDQGKTFVAPSMKAAMDKSYPITRPLYFFYAKTNEAKVKKLIDYALSAKGQAVVEKVGYVPLSK